MIMNARIILVVLLVALVASGSVIANDSDKTVPYFQARGFNVPILDGWEDQSSAEFAQFYLSEAQATIRTAIVPVNDAIAAAEQDLEEMLGADIGQPVYSDKVNLADGTWNVLVYDIDAATTASVMARRHEARSVVISFVESDPAARTVLLTMARTDEALDVATPEIARAIAKLTGIALQELDDEGVIELPSGAWAMYRRPTLAAMGMVFGNDSYVALQEGQLGDLAALAEAYNLTLLGFFITPDNSGYLALGLAATFIILGLLVLSYFWRARTMRQELALIEALGREEG